VGALTLAVWACALPGGSLYKESFGSSGGDWCIEDSNENSAISYGSGKFIMEATSTEWFVWCNPDQSFEDIHVEVTAENVNGTPDTTFGIMCHHQFLDDFYYVGINSEGEYTIRLYINDEDDILAEGVSDSIPVNAASYRIGMDCGEGRIALYVDGTLIDEATDSTYSSGDIGLYVWSGSEVPAVIHYDDLEVTNYSTEEQTEDS
jgi:hypothetical protein